MKIGILSDTHDHVKHITKAVSLFRKEGVRHLFHAGDFCSPFTIQLFRGYEMDAVFGNNDGDHFRLIAKFRENELAIHNEFFEKDVDGCHLALYHGTRSEITDALVRCGKYDLVISGHTHTVVNERINNTLMLNPGSAHGFDSQATVAVFDTETQEAVIHTL